MWQYQPDNFAEIPSNTSIEIQINVLAQQHKVKAVIVGQRENDFLIIELGRGAPWQQVATLLQDSSSVIIRCVLPCGSVMAGVTSYMTSATYPRKLIFLTFPSAVERRNLRNKPRMEVELAARLRFNETSAIGDLEGWVSDLSLGGVGFVCSYTNPVERDDIVEKSIDLDVIDEGNVLVTLIGHVRSCRLSRTTATTHLQLGVRVEGCSSQYPNCLNELILHSQQVKALFSESA